MGAPNLHAMRLRSSSADDSHRQTDETIKQETRASYLEALNARLQGEESNDSGPGTAVDDSGPDMNMDDNTSESSLDNRDPDPVPLDASKQVSCSRIWIFDPKQDNWGCFPRSPSSNCNICCDNEGSHNINCSTFRIHNCPPAFQIMLRTILHFLNYVHLKDALQNVSKKLFMLPTPEIAYPPVLMAMGLDWDTTCTQPFLKRLLHFYDLADDVICIERSKKNDGDSVGEVDLVLCLKQSSWRSASTRCKASNKIPICPIAVKNGAHDSPTDRLKGWFSDYFNLLKLNGITHDDYRWPIPYFVLDGALWRFGFAIKCGSSIELFEEPVGFMGWVGGVQKVMAVLRHVIVLTADWHREWYLEHST